jgi:hypothetical protein
VAQHRLGLVSLVVQQHLLVVQIGLPAEVGRVMVLDQHAPGLQGSPLHSALDLAIARERFAAAVTAEDVRARVSGIFEQPQHAAVF